MKKRTLIILGLLSLLLLGVWAYLLFFHTPDKEGGFFADFGWFTNQDVTPIEILPPYEDEIPLINVQGGPRLRQLTTRPVAGYTEVYSTTTEPYFVRYVEAGLGHIYEINMETGEEIRISNTTVPQAMRAEFSPSGKEVAIQADVTARNLVTVGRINNGEFTGQSLPATVTDFTFADTGELFYAEIPTQGTDTIGKSFNLTTGSTRELFTIPFRAATIGWAKDGRTTHYTYTKPASRLMGYLYTIRSGTIVREPVTGNGLNVIANDQYIIFTRRNGNQNESLALDRQTNTLIRLATIVIPEKCTFSKSEANVLYCAFELDIYNYNFIEEWYKGIRSFNDPIWQINLIDGSASVILPNNESLQPLDMYELFHSVNTLNIYFINKHNKTLWAYDLSF
jgi:hypothetical protein